MKATLLGQQSWLKPLVLLFFLSMPFLMFGQSGIETTLTDVKDWIVAVAHILFVVGMVVGIIRVVMAFISGSPNAPRYLVFLIIAALVWFGFSVLVGDFSGLGTIDNI